MLILLRAHNIYTSWPQGPNLSDAAGSFLLCIGLRLDDDNGKDDDSDELDDLDDVNELCGTFLL